MLRTLRLALLALPLAAMLAVAPPLAAQPAAAQPVDAWHLADGAPGISLDAAYALLADRTPQEVIVAIIDSGVDPTHPDLAPVMWVNPGETADNGVDDDGNGYADDVYGWSFLGGPGGNVEHETYEITRLVREGRARFATTAPEADPEGYAALQELETDLAAKVREYTFYNVMAGGMLRAASEADSILASRFEAYDPANPAALDVGMDMEASAAQSRLAQFQAEGILIGDLQTMMGQVTSALQYGYNVDYDPRGLVGDDPADLAERFYGVPDVHGPDPNHGTGVAGLVAAARGNGFGIDGIAPNTASGDGAVSAPVRIMALRAVPDGDERDKDIANAIRYAVDNGARVINMSFGKGYSPQKSAVDEAAQYAAARGVLLVHAAGNDSADLGDGGNFPTDVTASGETVSTWLEVGASTRDLSALAADFSNYGDLEVDLFAPGADVTSLAPGGEIQTANGTSFAAPVVAGVAALVMAYFPDLSAEEVRQILLDSATPLAETVTPEPASGKAVTFGSLSVTGGVVNAAEAVRLAMERATE